MAVQTISEVIVIRVKMPEEAVMASALKEAGFMTDERESSFLLAFLHEIGKKNLQKTEMSGSDLVDLYLEFGTYCHAFVPASGSAPKLIGILPVILPKVPESIGVIHDAKLRCAERKADFDKIIYTRDGLLRAF